MIYRIKLFNRHVDALLRQGGFHKELQVGLHQLHTCIASQFRSSIENAVTSGIVFSSAKLESDDLGKLLSILLWWPRRCGGLGAKHVAVALHDEDSRLAPLLSRTAGSSKVLQSCVNSALHVTSSRGDHYGSHLQAILGPVIEDTFGTS